MVFDKKSLDDYVEVSERIAKLREKYPDASLQAEIVRWPNADFPFIVAQAFCYRTPDDARPGVGWAAEPFPGRTPYTKDSETQNAETSAWGRAIVAALAADTKKGIASAEEIRSRAPSEEDGGKPVREAPSEREGKGGARTSGDRVDNARVGEGTGGSTSPEQPGGAEVTASVPSGTPSSGGAGTTPPVPSDPPVDETTSAFLFALDASLKNAFPNKTGQANAFMKDWLKRAGVQMTKDLSEQSRIALLEALADRAAGASA